MVNQRVIGELMMYFSIKLNLSFLPRFLQKIGLLLTTLWCIDDVSGSLFTHCVRYHSELS